MYEDSPILAFCIAIPVMFIGAVPEALSHRGIHNKAAAKVIEFLEEGGKEPEFILLPDSRYEEEKRREQLESYKKNRW